MNRQEMSVISYHEALGCDGDQLALGFSCDRNCEFKTICVRSQNFSVHLIEMQEKWQLQKNRNVQQAEMKN